MLRYLTTFTAYFLAASCAFAQDGGNLFVELQSEYPDVAYKEDISSKSIYTDFSFKSDSFNFFASTMSFENLDDIYAINFGDAVIENERGDLLKAKEIFIVGNVHYIYDFLSTSKLDVESDCGDLRKVIIKDYAFFDRITEAPFMYGSYLDFDKKSELVNSECNVTYDFDIRDVYHSYFTEMGVINTNIGLLNGSTNFTLDGDFSGFSIQDVSIDLNLKDKKRPFSLLKSDGITMSVSEKYEKSPSGEALQIFNKMITGEFIPTNPVSISNFGRFNPLKSNMEIDKLIFDASYFIQNNPFLVSHFKNDYITIDSFLKNSLLKDEKTMIDFSLNINKMGSIRWQMEYSGMEYSENINQTFFSSPLTLHNFKVKMSEDGLDKFIKIVNHGKGPHHGKGLLSTVSDILGVKGLGVDDYKISLILDWLKESQWGNISFLELASDEGVSLQSLIELLYIDIEQIQKGFLLSK